jgi:hypothetical protein
LFFFIAASPLLLLLLVADGSETRFSDLLRNMPPPFSASSVSGWAEKPQLIVVVLPGRRRLVYVGRFGQRSFLARLVFHGRSPLYVDRFSWQQESVQYERVLGRVDIQKRRKEHVVNVVNEPLEKREIAHARDEQVVQERTEAGADQVD